MSSLHDMLLARNKFRCPTKVNEKLSSSQFPATSLCLICSAHCGRGIHSYMQQWTWKVFNKSVGGETLLQSLKWKCASEYLKSTMNWEYAPNLKFSLQAATYNGSLSSANDFLYILYPYYISYLILGIICVGFSTWHTFWLLSIWEEWTLELEAPRDCWPCAICSIWASLHQCTLHCIATMY